MLVKYGSTVRIFVEGHEMLQYKAGYKFVEGGVHAQVLDFPAAISCGDHLDDARRMLSVALLDVAETLLEMSRPLPKPNPAVSDPEMDLEEPNYLHLSVSPEQDITQQGIGGAVDSLSDAAFRATEAVAAALFANAKPIDQEGLGGIGRHESAALAAIAEAHVGREDMDTFLQGVLRLFQDLPITKSLQGLDPEDERTKPYTDAGFVIQREIVSELKRLIAAGQVAHCSQPG